MRQYRLSDRVELDDATGRYSPTSALEKTMSSRIAAALLITIAVAILCLPGGSAYTGSYVAMALCLVALVTYGWAGRDILRAASIRAILAALFLVSLSLPFVYRSVQDLMGIVILLPMLCAISVAILMRVARPTLGPTIFAILCLTGAAAAFTAGLAEQIWLLMDRPGLGTNPIHYGSLAAMAGGLAVVGAVASRSPWRYLFLLGPAFGIAATLLSGSRGPLMGALIMAAGTCPFLVTWFWREQAFRIAAIASLCLSVVAIMAVLGSGNYRALSIFESAFNIFRFTGSSDDIRAAFYVSSIQAFVDSPVYGHGLGQLMDTVRRMFPGAPNVLYLEHLHADWANFAVMSGSLGLLAYAALLAAPLLALRSAKARADRPVLLGTVVLFCGQLTLGTSNAVFGVLPQTVMYAVMAGYLIGRSSWLERH